MYRVTFTHHPTNAKHRQHRQVYIVTDDPTVAISEATSGCRSVMVRDVHRVCDAGDVIVPKQTAKQTAKADGEYKSPLPDPVVGSTVWTSSGPAWPGLTSDRLRIRGGSDAIDHESM